MVRTTWGQKYWVSPSHHWGVFMSDSDDTCYALSYLEIPKCAVFLFPRFFLLFFVSLLYQIVNVTRKSIHENHNVVQRTISEFRSTFFSLQLSDFS